MRCLGTKSLSSNCLPIEESPHRDEKCPGAPGRGRLGRASKGDQFHLAMMLERKREKGGKTVEVGILSVSKLYAGEDAQVLG